MSAECFPVGEYLSDELDARGWTICDCAERMGGDVELNACKLDFLIAVPDVLLDEETAHGLERALGSSAQCWMNLDAAYHKCMAEKLTPAKERLEDEEVSTPHPEA